MISILACPLECKCTDGNPSNGGVNVNVNGFCEFYCNENSWGRYCGATENYKEAPFIDCRGCNTGFKRPFYVQNRHTPYIGDFWGRSRIIVTLYFQTVHLVLKRMMGTYQDLEFQEILYLMHL